MQDCRVRVGEMVAVVEQAHLVMEKLWNRRRKKDLHAGRYK